MMGGRRHSFVGKVMMGGDGDHLLQLVLTGVAGKPIYFVLYSRWYHNGPVILH